MKKIVFVIESLHLGGAEKSLVTLLRNIDCAKYKVDLILFKQGGVFLNEVPNHLNIIYNTIPKLSFLERLDYKLKRILNNKKYHHAQLLWNLLEHKIKVFDKKYDIAIAYNQGFATYFVDSFIKSERKIAWLNIDYQNAGYNIDSDYLIYNNFERIIAVSPEAKNGLKNELKSINKELKIDVIKDITDKRDILKKSVQQNGFEFNKEKINIVTVGRLAKQKGLHLALESCEILLQKGYEIEWFVVGEGGERDFLQKQIIKANMTGNFMLVGMTDNPYPYIRDCDIYVQTSLFEGLGLTVIEASYLNKPIVSTNFPTVYGILEDGVTGLISEMNSQSIAAKIELLINDNDLKNNLVKHLSLKVDTSKEDSLAKINNLLKSNTLE